VATVTGMAIAQYLQKPPDILHSGCCWFPSLEYVKKLVLNRLCDGLEVGGERQEIQHVRI
jgi:hypothetical protein